jgi:drug/metabolite transporter (DMT)-like permease
LVIAAAILNLLVPAFGRTWPKGEALKAAIWYGFLEFGSCLPLLYWGEKTVPSGLAAVLYATCPIAAMVAARALGMEKLNPTKLAAAFVAVAGVALIFWKELASGGNLASMISVFLAACSASIAGVLLQRGPRQDALGANAVGAAVGIPTCLLASLLLHESQAFPRTVAELGPVLYLAIASSVIAFGMFAWLMNHMRATTVSFLGVIVPVIAVALGAAVHHEKITAPTLAGALVVVAATAVALRADVIATAKPT